MELFKRFHQPVKDEVTMFFFTKDTRADKILASHEIATKKPSIKW